MTESTIYLISDSTGETLHAVVRAVIAQYPNVNFKERIYSSIRSETQILEILQEVASHNGLVLYTMVNKNLNEFLQKKSQSLRIRSIDILSPLMLEFSHYYQQEASGTPGGQHKLNSAYFERIEALDFSYQHDDGLSIDTIQKADIIILGVSRTSKTPTSVYMANRGIKVANIPYVHHIPLPDKLYKLKGKFYCWYF